MPTNYVLAAVGRARPGPEQDLFSLYRQRLSFPLIVREVEEKRPLPAAQKKAREGELLLAEIPAGAFTVVLDERGRDISSPAFAEIIRNARDNGTASIAFLIGGADGHEQFVRDRANCLLGLGKLTWPHMLVRVLLAEQIYRSECILAKHPYHRG